MNSCSCAAVASSSANAGVDCRGSPATSAATKTNAAKQASLRMRHRVPQMAEPRMRATDAHGPVGHGLHGTFSHGLHGTFSHGLHGTFSHGLHGSTRINEYTQNRSVLIRVVRGLRDRCRPWPM